MKRKECGNMMMKDVERIFEITKDNQYTKITVNKVTKVLVAKSGKIYLVFDSGNWQYYDSKEKIEIIPRGKGLYNIKGKYENPLKMYCKAWSVEIECENIWREVVKFAKDSKIVC
jgi:hypothetical protein